MPKPLMFIQRHGGFRRDPSGAVWLGLRHGAYCVGCCWMLMALLFVGGVIRRDWTIQRSGGSSGRETLPTGCCGMDFVTAYEVALSRCSTEWAPWFVIPSDRKWVRSAAIAQIVRDTLVNMDPAYPAPDWDPAQFTVP
jgi:hypothetical protein